ncbi:helix-turn-helix domain-containing protein [Haliea sp.]
MPEKQSLPRILRPSNSEGIVHAGDWVDANKLAKTDGSLGFDIRDLRKARGMTLSELSKISELSQGYLSQVERGISVPSIKALHSISRALGVTISWFFQNQVTGEDQAMRAWVVRSGNRRKLTFNTGIVDELLSPNLSRQIEMLKCTFPPGTSSGDVPYTHQGEEAGIILTGKLNLWIEGTHIVLEEGDSFAFASSKPHRYANLEDVETVVIWTITPPSY